MGSTQILQPDILEWKQPIIGLKINTFGHECTKQLLTIYKSATHANGKEPHNGMKSYIPLKNVQERQKGYYDKSIRPIEFKIRDQVLLYKLAKEKVYGNKLKEKWKGPYFIHDYRALGTYKLQTIEGKVLKIW
ncbi:12085_t:CDS:2 [Dentiscutata erythropus]|uniref:12085_t:CDS:1 n=1 Tax=Dentiscutata erythropus TaxID=1348616 RepID=A0A9N9C3V6_9GLOM|nr:12085_t:CDS:2 [Dentiscutata erythropus]